MKRTFFILFSLILSACAGKASKTTTASTAIDPTLPGILRNIAEGIKCDAKMGREELVDLSQDGVYNVRKVYKTVGNLEALVCYEADTNFDGVMDIFKYFNDQGQLIRDELDLDYNGKIDIVTHWANGTIIKQEIDQNSDGIADCVRYFENGVVVRMEGDLTQDGKVDYWEYYEDGRLVRIGLDLDGDGKADRWDRDEEFVQTTREAVTDAEESEENDESENE